MGFLVRLLIGPSVGRQALGKREPRGAHPTIVGSGERTGGRTRIEHEVDARWEVSGNAAWARYRSHPRSDAA